MSDGSRATAYDGVAGHDFRRDWRIRWSCPHPILGYWLTPCDRGDMQNVTLVDVLYRAAPKAWAQANPLAQAHWKL